MQSFAKISLPGICWAAIGGKPEHAHVQLGATVTVRWGVAGPGGIASQFGEGMKLVEGGTIVAVASRSQQRADDYGDRFDVPKRYDDYSALAEDPEVDAVYIATPHSRHESDTIPYLQAGKHVLCEKPFALNAHQALRMVEAARANDVFLMEALWSRFLPSYRLLGDLLAEGRIGEPLLVEADFGFRSPVDPTHRHFDLAQGGGALLDLGIYPLQLCDLVLGTPERILADGTVGETHVDEHVIAVLHHPGGGIGVAKAAIRVPMACTARIAGSEGVIEIPAFMHCPRSLSVRVGREVEQIEAGWEGEGLRFQVEEVHRCLEQGARESAVWPLAKTIELATTMDSIRRQVGVTYPGADE
jgi:predicted dehydrogenase